MNRLGASAIFYLFVGVTFVMVFLLAPYPHYNINTNAWYLGASTFNRITGQKEEGIPLEQVFSKVSKARVTSPFRFECNQNSDCITYITVNQCKVYCGNLDNYNKDAQALLNNNRVCDPAKWNMPATRCACLEGTCVNVLE